MSCQQCMGLERIFGERTARSDLRRYRNKGPNRTTELLIQALIAEGVADASVIDIGGGVGAIPIALLDAGATSARMIDASHAYLEVAEQEAKRRGLYDRMSFRFGDFAKLAAEESQAEVVTLDRVICCYDDATVLVSASASHANRLYGLVYPRDTWLNRLGSRIVNAMIGLTRTGYQSFIHPQELVDRLIAEHQLRKVFHQELSIWQVAVYRRED